ncbi:peptidase domain-containing ABC transporter [Moorena sp. SIO4G3]|uniref:peptidase domain-containing ABC transporter n=1 Tax=Moorena sp. SIO4G3 TaxID=2607821 RepID=UPI00142A389C|nr:peptidase domain-containing ABC transporter [Moorena sp. SIO4G3]NEO76544.1 type I secretion system permease/ATPase [Moorena sp. SIO4G3]
MTYTTTIQEFLAGISPFNQLSRAARQKLSTSCQLLRYRMGQTIVVRDKMPGQISILFQGKARLIGYDQRRQTPTTLKLLQPGAILGWVSLVRGIPCETAIASVEAVCVTINVADFLGLLDTEKSFCDAFKARCGLVEIFDLLGTELGRRAEAETDLKALALLAWSDALVYNLPRGKQMSSQLDPNRVWFVSGGAAANLPVGSCLSSEALSSLQVNGHGATRLVGIPEAIFSEATATDSETLAEPTDTIRSIPQDDIPQAPDRPDEAPETIYTDQTTPTKFPFIRGKGAVQESLACFQMLSKYFKIPFRKDSIRKVLKNQHARTGQISLQHCGAVAELMGLTAQLATIPANAIKRLPTPAMLLWHDSLAILYEASERQVVLAVPQLGIQKLKPKDFEENWGEGGQVLLLKPTKDTPTQRFGLSWFWPSIVRYRKVLAEVLIASFFVQLLGLAYPLIIRVLIDKVISQNSTDTLQVLGILLLVVSVFEGVLITLRTYLFVDTTNRIDMSLGSEIIDHLLRLPLNYFEKRPVGELSTRINELENIRSFLTGTALTVVLDSVFSIIYIVVMFMFSWVLTVVTLSVIPLFMLLTLIVSPIVRQQLRNKAERNAQTQSYLVEVLSGISTVKAQNIELRSRWKWQEKYGRYVSEGFKNVLTSTAASSMSTFLNKLSGLLVLWVGVYLVLDGQLSLGGLIAFRIIGGYVTSPLLRLAQLWQNFQSTALSLERLSDIVDTPKEVAEADQGNIPLPSIRGDIRYENLSFRFAKSGPMQLNNINVEIPAGSFVGIVGQSGSGKSTMTKLLARLYGPESGRIIVDGYDISKVELYSLRRQIGIVPQETLLFEGSVQENIALTNPDADSEEIIQAAKIAVAHDFIMGLPLGYNSSVGERGSGLSGGQRQRIAIARTILQSPQLMILDEATSALDYDTERQVCLNLAEAFQQSTVLFITHRLGTIRNADIILMMDRGSIVEQGTHDELMAQKGRYYCLYMQQDAQM